MRAGIARALVCGHLIFAGYPGLGYAQELILYPIPQLTQKHCPHDEVVWLNTHSGIWHIEGARLYAHTKQGAYVCKKEAATAGNRGSLNG